MSYTKIFSYLRSQKSFTAFLTTLIVIGSSSALFAARKANAEVVLLNVRDTLTTAIQSAPTKHTINFTPVNTIPGNEDLQITLPAGFTVPALAFGDFSVASTSAYTGVSSCAAAGGTFAASSTGLVVNIRTCTNSSFAAGVPITIVIGTGATKMSNPASTGSYTVQIRNASTAQSQKIQVAIVSNVLMTAAVDPILNFTVSGTASGSTVNGTTTNIVTTPSTIDFGTLVPNTQKVAAQQLSVSSNARNGYVVTAQTDSDFKSANGATIDGFNYGGASSTASAWAAPTASVADDRTWGHVALTTDDLTATLPSIASNMWVGNFLQNPVTVMSEASSTKNKLVLVGYEVQISDLQEAATDYKTNIIYVATPSF